MKEIKELDLQELEKSYKILENRIAKETQN